MTALFSDHWLHLWRLLSLEATYDPRSPQPPACADRPRVRAIRATVHCRQAPRRRGGSDAELSLSDKGIQRQALSRVETGGPKSRSRTGRIFARFVTARRSIPKIPRNLGGKKGCRNAHARRSMARVKDCLDVNTMMLTVNAGQSQFIAEPISTTKGPREDRRVVWQNRFLRCERDDRWSAREAPFMDKPDKVILADQSATVRVPRCNGAEDDPLRFRGNLYSTAPDLGRSSLVGSTSGSAQALVFVRRRKAVALRPMSDPETGRDGSRIPTRCARFGTQGIGNSTLIAREGALSRVEIRPYAGFSGDQSGVYRISSSPSASDPADVHCGGVIHYEPSDGLPGHSIAPARPSTNPRPTGDAPPLAGHRRNRHSGPCPDAAIAKAL